MDAYLLEIETTFIQKLQRHVLECDDRLNAGFNLYNFAKTIETADLNVLHEKLKQLHAEKMDEGYLEKFETDPGIQRRLRATKP